MFPTPPAVLVVLPLLLAGALSNSTTTVPAGSTDQRLPVQMVMPCDGWLRVEERGQDVRFEHPGGMLSPSLPAQRYGRLLVQVRAEVVITLLASGPGTGWVRTGIVCDETEVRSLLARATWLTRIQSAAAFVDQELRLPPPAAAPLNALVETASTPEDRAYALHLAAQAALWREEYLLADTTFRAAHEAWLAVDDRARAGLADLGLALALRTRSMFSAVPALADRAARLLPADDRYLQAKAREERCLGWHSLHRLEQSRDCYAQVAREHAALGEADAELNTRYNQAFVLRDLGEHAAAAELLEAAEQRADAATGEVRPKTRGQLALLRGMLAREDGQIGTALSALERAARWFELAPELGSNWRANALVRVAELYGQLGLSELAYRQLESALSLYRAAEAPSRIAGTLMKLASIERAQGEPVRAAHWFERAATIYRRLDLRLELAEAELGRLENSVPDDPARAQALLVAPQAVLSALSAAERPRYRLLRARWMLVAEQWSQAGQALATIAAMPLSLPLRLDAQSLQASLLARDDPAAALKQLRDAIQSVHAEAMRCAGALGFLTLRMARGLRGDWTRLALKATLTPQQWWSVALDSSATQALSPAPAGAAVASSDALSFGESIAQEMLPGTRLTVASTDTALLRSLVDSVTRPKSRADQISLRRAQAALPEDGWLLVILPAEPNSAALWISRTQAVVLPLPGERQLHDASGAMLAVLGSRSQPTRDIHLAAQTLSAQLFSGAPQARPPRTLWVLADDSFSSLPLALLRWPGQDAELVETTATSWITRVAADRPAPQSITTVITLMADFADQDPAGRAAGLKPLLAAASEPATVAAALAPQPVRQLSQAAFSRTALREALASPGAWIHIASHGSAQTGRLGYAGLWLPPARAGDAPDFVSWLDLIDKPLAAQLLVLNSCELAAAPRDARQANVSFATALSAAGVHEVVAAHWAISDIASALWVPQFYSALKQQRQPDSAEALRLAQLALKHSRAFRHPYAWASLGHFRRLQIAASTY